MKILNPGPEDYHIHSITFSDGWNSVDEIVKYTGEIGMTKIAICDHSAGITQSRRTFEENISVALQTLAECLQQC